jgi:hypothetical protein
MNFGFGSWYKYGYKIIGWATTEDATTPDYTDKYYNVSDSWINTNGDGISIPQIDLYAVWAYNGLVRIAT